MGSSVQFRSTDHQGARCFPWESFYGLISYPSVPTLVESEEAADEEPSRGVVPVPDINPSQFSVSRLAHFLVMLILSCSGCVLEQGKSCQMNTVNKTVISRSL